MSGIDGILAGYESLRAGQEALYTGLHQHPKLSHAGEVEAGAPVRAGLRSVDRSGLRPFASLTPAGAAGRHGDWRVICSPVPG
jgi:hypothetical protein